MILYDMISSFMTLMDEVYIYMYTHTHSHMHTQGHIYIDIFVLGIG